MNQENAPATFRNDPRSSATEDLEAIFEPCDFWQRRSAKSYHKFSLEKCTRTNTIVTVTNYLSEKLHVQLIDRLIS